MEKPIFSLLNTRNTKLIKSVKKTNNSSYHERKIRFDKTHTMRFPVTEEQEKSLRRAYILYKSQFNNESITSFITSLLRFGLRHQELHKEIDYKDTKKYKTVKPNQIEYEMISGVHGLAIEWGLSERQALHRIVISVLIFLNEGGKLTDEEVQQIRPSK